MDRVGCGLCWSGPGMGGTITIVQLKKREPVVSGSEAKNEEFTGDAALPAGLSLILAASARPT